VRSPLAVDRRSIVERVWSDPPLVHDWHEGDQTVGVWKTDRACYDLIADRCAPGDATLETGIGLSTALFAALGARHTCVAPLQSEADRLLQHCEERGIPTEDLNLVAAFSDDVLPTIDLGELAVVFIDGGHGFPVPMLDWYYGARHLREGGVCVVDDLRLHVPAILAQFLDMDPSWRRVARTAKWGAWERLNDGDLRADHWQQRFITGFAATTPGRKGIAVRRARRVAGRIRARLRSALGA
jgi:hypothetical protein